MRELYSNHKVALALAEAQITSDTNGIVVDTYGFGSVMFAIAIGAVAAADADNKLAFEIEEGDLANGSDMADIPAARILGAAVVNATTQASSTKRIGAVLGTKRYVRLVLNETGTVDAYVNAMAILGHPRHAPVAAQD